LLVGETKLEALVALVVHAAIGLGDNERAFAGFKVALTQHSNVLTYLKLNPAYDSLQGDPRYDDLMRRVGLSQ